MVESPESGDRTDTKLSSEHHPREKDRKLFGLEFMKRNQPKRKPRSLENEGTPTSTCVLNLQASMRRAFVSSKEGALTLLLATKNILTYL